MNEAAIYLYGFPKASSLYQQVLDLYAAQGEEAAYRFIKTLSRPEQEAILEEAAKFALIKDTQTHIAQAIAAYRSKN